MENTDNIFVDEEFGVDLSDVMSGASEGEGAEQENDRSGIDTTPSQPTAAGAEQEGAPKDSGDLFELKFNKETRQVSRAEMVELAQKGLNHDRIRQQRDTLQTERDQLAQWRRDREGTFAELETLAQAQGVDVPGLLTGLRENALVQQGMSREVAHERVLREQAERRLADSQTRDQAARQAQQEADAAQARQKQDIDQFLQLYKDVDARTIPQSVWDAVRKGETLVSAYGRYENQRLQAENKQLQERLTALEQNGRNRELTLGSVRTDGQEAPKDEFLEALMSD